MSLLIEYHVCSTCNDYCDDDYCFSCDSDNVWLQQRPDVSHEIRASVQEQLKGRSSVEVFLSSFGEMPSKIATVSLSVEELFEILNNNVILSNGITTIHNKGALRECIGLAFPMQLQHKFDSITDEVYGMMIITDNHPAGEHPSI